MIYRIKRVITKPVSCRSAFVEAVQKLQLFLMMGRKAAETTENDRKIIIGLHNQCKSLAEIALIVNRPRSTIQSIIDRFGLRKTVQNKQRSGRPKQLNA